MIKKIYFIITVFSFFGDLGLHAQGLYMPRNYKRAVKNETRSLNGKPGIKYWQNRSRYLINMTALPPDRSIRGEEEIVYFNNSPDTLKLLHLKLFLNIHKPGAPRESTASSAYLTSGMQIDQFSVNGLKENFGSTENQYTEKNIKLPQSLLPHDSIHLSFSWHYPISLESGREGMIDSTTWFLAYFYPRIAVYDDYEGWDDVPFVEAKEFYSDFNDYKVSINVPANYIVWGTGTLLNAGQVLQPFYAAKFKASLTGDSIFHMAGPKELQEHKITMQKPINTWMFQAKNIPDMTFCLSNQYNWDASSTMASEHDSRRVSVQAAYDDKSADFHQMVEYGKHAIYWLSNNWPGIAYPYEKSTIVQGFAGMEYPMMVNDETYRDTLFSRFVAEHEIAHTYMPFYMGINETRYGFMDEGWATTFEHLIADSEMGKEKSADFYKEFRVNNWAETASADQDLPIITPGSSLSGEGLGNNEYGKPSLGYLAVKDMLGDVLFKKCLHTYMSDWHGRHPAPWDFFNDFSRAAGASLNWFWTNWYFSNNYIDLSVRSVNTSPLGATIMIDNIGGMFTPFDLVGVYADGTTLRVHQTANTWKNSPKLLSLQLPSRKKLRSILIDSGIFVDADPGNNSWKAR